jgi:ferredoxin
MIIVDRELCNYCGTCVAVCPENIIELVDIHLEIEQNKCIKCQICVNCCPVGALELNQDKQEGDNSD